MIVPHKFSDDTLFYVCHTREVAVCMHWHRLVKNWGETTILGENGCNNWWKQRRFSIIGGTCLRCPSKSMTMSVYHTIILLNNPLKWYYWNIVVPCNYNLSYLHFLRRLLPLSAWIPFLTGFSLHKGFALHCLMLRYCYTSAFRIIHCSMVWQYNSWCSQNSLLIDLTFYPYPRWADLWVM